MVLQAKQPLLPRYLIKFSLRQPARARTLIVNLLLRMNGKNKPFLIFAYMIVDVIITILPGIKICNSKYSLAFIFSKCTVDVKWGECFLDNQMSSCCYRILFDKPILDRRNQKVFNFINKK